MNEKAVIRAAKARGMKPNLAVPQLLSQLSLRAYDLETPEQMLSLREEVIRLRRASFGVNRSRALTIERSLLEAEDSLFVASNKVRRGESPNRELAMAQDKLRGAYRKW